MQTNLFRYSFFLAFISILWTGCTDPNTHPETSNNQNIASPTQNIPTKIETHLLSQKTTFNTQFQTTGLLKARETSIIKANTSGKLKQLYAIEGKYIKKGNQIAKLEDQHLQLQLQQLQNDLNEARFKKNELLIQFDGKMGVDSSVSPIILNTIHIKSGYDKVVQSIKQTKYEISQTRIHAPFSGIVSDIKVKRYEFVNTGETICTLINPNSFEAEFLLLENEALKAKKGQSLKVIPIAIPELELQANIARINPVVNEQGLVKLYAKITSKKRHLLFEGMNVSVIIENNIPKQLVIPKQALVLRSGKEVIFTYDAKEKLAKWNYVKVAYENNTQIAISEGLKEGDLVIIEGNNNLAHDSEVVLKSTDNDHLASPE